MNQKERNSMLMDAIAVSEAWFKNGQHLKDMSLKQRKVLKNTPDHVVYAKLSAMNLGATSSASRIMLLNIDGRKQMSKNKEEKKKLPKMKGCAEYISDDTFMITEGPWKGKTITLSVEVLED